MKHFRRQRNSPLQIEQVCRSFFLRWIQKKVQWLQKQGKKMSTFIVSLSLKIKVIFSARFLEHFKVERKHFYMQCLHDFWQTIPLYFSQTISHDFPQSISHDFWQTLHLPISHRWCISTSLRRHKKLFPPFPFWTFCSGQSFINFDKLC